MSKFLFNGNWPHLGVLCIAIACLLAGAMFAQKFQKTEILTADRGALILKVVMEHPELSAEEQREKIVKLIQKVLNKYVGFGNVVLDVSRDDSGLMMVAGIPHSARDITDEMRDEIERAFARDAGGPAK